MKRYEKWNQIQGNKETAEVQAVGMIVAELIDNQIPDITDPGRISGKMDRDSLIMDYMNKFKAIVKWMNEEVGE